MADAFESLYRAEHARVLSSVLARVRDFPVAEECVQEAFAAALEQWAAPPPNPRAWLIRVAVNKAIDRVRRSAKLPEVAMPEPEVEEEIFDERLRLIFTCCHPAIAAEAQVALTLRTVAGLATEEIARLFLVEPKAMAQRLVRTQRKIQDARIPYVVPSPERLHERVSAVLAVVYLVFTEGYAATSGELLICEELCEEAIRLGRVIVELMPQESEAHALLALMLLQDSRRAARVVDGEIVLLEAQDRSRWDRARIDEGLALLDDALRGGARGPYALQAAIAGLHARAPSAAATDWAQILAVYDLLFAVMPTPIVELNRGAALGMAQGAEAGLRVLDGLRMKLDENHLFHAARADLLMRLGRASDAARAYRAALRSVVHPAERRFLERQLAACG